MATTLKPEFTIEKITPKMARAYLEKNIEHNRPLRKHRVAQIADAMKRGQWVMSGESVKFDSDGNMFDGQHRMTGVIESGATVQMLVGRNITREAYDIIDSGLKRTNADHLTRLGLSSASLTASVAKMLIGYYNELNLLNTAEMSMITNKDITEFVLTNQQMLEQAVSMGNNVYQQVGGNATAWSSFVFMAMNAGWDKSITEFLYGIVNGEGLTGGDPRLALRNWLMRNRTIGRSNQRIFNIATFSKLFNNYNRGDVVRGVKPWKSDQEWPHIIPNKNK